ncbi:unnamed protein product [Rotaria sp. Silwood2]|nr:unnamed protein product [Rotaria sp. Silwood2]
MANYNKSDFFLFININSSILPLSYSENSSTLHSSSDSTKKNISEHLKLVERLTTHITLIVSIIGLIGNACTIIVLNRQSMRKWRSSILLSSLAAVDFLYLLIIFLSIIDELTNQTIGLNQSLILCQVTVYITHVCSFLSASFTLSFTSQRFIAVIFPLHAKTIISNRSSITNIVVLLVFGCSFYSFSFFVTNVSHGKCIEDETYPALFPLLLADICLTFVIPFIFIVIFNCAIVYQLQHRKKFSNFLDSSLTMIRTPYSRGKLSTLHLTGVHDYIEQGRLYQANHDANGCGPSDNGNKTSDTPEPLNHTVCASVVETTTKPNEYSTRLSNPRASVLTISNDLICTPPNSNNNRQAISQRTTKMLVICSTTFLLLNSPYSAVLLYSIISKHVLTSTLGILRHFYFMSFCLNFFLYSLWGNRFRQEFILLLKSCCTFFVIKYKYTSKAIFQYVPTTIIDQTALNITADVNFYQSKSPCNQSFVKLQNLIINSFQHDSIHMDIKQLEKAIFQIFIETSNILQNTTQDIIFLNDYYNNSNQYRQIKTVRTNDGQFIGNSLFANYVFNKLVPPTKTTCETIININEKKLEKSTCISTTAILLTINRQISFDSKLDNQTFILTSKNLTSTQLKTTTKTDFDQLLKQICAKY